MIRFSQFLLEKKTKKTRRKKRKRNRPKGYPVPFYGGEANLSGEGGGEGESGGGSEG